MNNTTVLSELSQAIVEDEDQVLQANVVHGEEELIWWVDSNLYGGWGCYGELISPIRWR
jgi:hypothetical protein